jgi:hypothetical protein
LETLSFAKVNRPLNSLHLIIFAQNKQMYLQVDTDNWFFTISRFMGGMGIFLVIAVILVVLVTYNRFFKNRK